ncbi:MAG: glycosyltransferase N-terminal domain-containing protein [Flavobacteriales bacterium]|nr:glycosyltransferase N-terminal domain-containing protein [Flavobacteriales bacterium]
MNILYNAAMYALSAGVRLHALFNAKSAEAVKGRKNWREELKKKISSLPKSEKRLWFHASSLGEFEQGRPVMEALKAKDADIQIILTFFSPSGYTVRHDYCGADVVCYLPWDTPKAGRDFIDIVNPSQVVFIKYEFWANILTEIHRRHIPLYLISARFKENSVFFKKYGGFFRNLLGMFTHILLRTKRAMIYSEG